MKNAVARDEDYPHHTCPASTPSAVIAIQRPMGERAQQRPATWLILPLLQYRHAAGPRAWFRRRFMDVAPSHQASGVRKLAWIGTAVRLVICIFGD